MILRAGLCWLADGGQIVEDVGQGHGFARGEVMAFLLLEPLGNDERRRTGGWLGRFLAHGDEDTPGQTRDGGHFRREGVRKADPGLAGVDALGVEG